MIMDNSRKLRNSSIELFRIISMLFVVVVHYNGWMVGGMAEYFDLSSISIHFVSQSFIQGLTAVCVNCFLVITGYYGLKLKGRTFWNIWVILVSIYVPCYIVNSFYSGQFHITGFVDNIIAFTRESYYPQCYLMLVFLSPILNSFIEKYGKKITIYVVCFWLIEFLFDFVRNNKSLGFNHGYSLIHFVLMYMLGRLAYMNKDFFLKLKGSKFYVGGYLICAFIMSMTYIFGLDYSRSFSYTNPLNVIAAFCLFFAFLKKSYYSKSINKIAASTFSVFILHTTSPIFDIISKIDILTLSNYSYSVYLIIGSIVVLSVFVLCIIYDKIRILLTGRLSDYIYEKLANKINLVLNKLSIKYV